MDSPHAPRTKARYAAQLLPFATRIVESVHDGSHAELLTLIGRARALDSRPDDVDPDVALVTIIAAMVNPTATTNTLLGWVRDLTPVKIAQLDTAADYEVTLCTEGSLPASTLTPTQRRQAVQVLHDRGLTADQIAHRTGLTDRSVARIRHELGLTKPRNTEEAA